MANMTGFFGGNAFDPSQVDEPQGFEPLPTDVDFHFEIGEAELKETSTGGTMLKIRCNVLGPTHAGRVIFANFNVQNASEDAERIAQQQLGAVCRALGITALQDSDELIGWARRFGPAPRECFVVHGEPDAADALRMRLKDELHWSAHVAEHGQRVEV